VGSCEHGNKTSGSIKGKEFLGEMGKNQLVKRFTEMFSCKFVLLKELVTQYYVCTSYSISKLLLFQVLNVYLLFMLCTHYPFSGQDKFHHRTI
jgi:hypothetical protein